MRSGAGQPFQRFTARQTIRTSACAFDWRAAMGPLGAIKVVDALEGPRGILRARLFGMIPLATLVGGGQILKGELQRYLAELPWSPDAILHNRALRWQGTGADRLQVSATVAGVTASVEFTLSGDGLIESVCATDRPRLIGKRLVESRWEGRFGSYQAVHGRTIPWEAQVGWAGEAGTVVVWRARLVDWQPQP